MYAKIEHGLVTAYPYDKSQFIRDNPQTSFPATLPDNLLEDYGVFHVVSSDQPVHDVMTQMVVEITPVLIGQTWTQQWEIRLLSQDEIDARVQINADVAAIDSAKLDAVIQYLVTHTPDECAQYVQDNVTDLASAKAFLKNVAKALSVLARKELR